MDGPFLRARATRVGPSFTRPCFSHPKHLPLPRQPSHQCRQLSLLCRSPAPPLRRAPPHHKVPVSPRCGSRPTGSLPQAIRPRRRAPPTSRQEWQLASSCVGLCRSWHQKRAVAMASGPHRSHDDDAPTTLDRTLPVPFLSCPQDQNPLQLPSLEDAGWWDALCRLAHQANTARRRCAARERPMISEGTLARRTHHVGSTAARHTDQSRETHTSSS